MLITFLFRGNHQEGLCPSRFGCAGPTREACRGIVRQYQQQIDEDLELIEEEPESHDPQILRHIVLLIFLLSSMFVVRELQYNDRSILISTAVLKSTTFYLSFPSLFTYFYLMVSALFTVCFALLVIQCFYFFSLPFCFLSFLIFLSFSTLSATIAFFTTPVSLYHSISFSLPPFSFLLLFRYSTILSFYRCSFSPHIFLYT